jgi:hypothetical protein
VGCVLGDRAHRASITLFLGAVVLGFFVGAAEAARPATGAEQHAILRAAGLNPDGASFKSGCVLPSVRVSGSYAVASFTFRPSSACVRYAFNGSNGFRLRAGSWKQVFIGSELPACSLGLPADLTPCQPITALASVTALGYERAFLTGDTATACYFLSSKGLVALRKQLKLPASAGCLSVMRVWAGEPNHGLPDNIAKLHVLSQQIRGATALVVVGGLNGLSPAKLSLHEQSARWFVDTPTS